jgi:hypothetical protein
MNLSISVKAGIVSKIMHDVPKVNYAALVQEHVQKVALDLMPAPARALYDDVTLRPFLNGKVGLYISGYNALGHVGGIYWRAPNDRSMLYLSKFSRNGDMDEMTKKLLDAVHGPIELLAGLADKQFRARRSMENKLREMLTPVRTLKQAKVVLEPQLHHYLPEDIYAMRNRAASAGTALVLHVVSDLAAMGWPKDQVPAEVV